MHGLYTAVLFPKTRNFTPLCLSPLTGACKLPFGGLDKYTIQETKLHFFAIQKLSKHKSLKCNLLYLHVLTLILTQCYYFEHFEIRLTSLFQTSFASRFLSELPTCSCNELHTNVYFLYF